MFRQLRSYWSALCLIGLVLLAGCAENAGRVESYNVEPRKNVQLDDKLLNLQQEYDAHLNAGGGWEAFRTSHGNYQLYDGRVAIDAIAASEIQDLVTSLDALGAINLSSYGRVVSCYFPIEKIDQLARLESLASARAAMAITR